MDMGKKILRRMKQYCIRQRTKAKFSDAHICVRRNFIVTTLCMSVVWYLTGCAWKQNSENEINNIPYPNYAEVLDDTDEIHVTEEKNEAVIPAKIYFDNTGSMEGFTRDENGARRPDDRYVKMMRCLRDMGRIQTIENYVLDEKQQEWISYGGSLYEDFVKDGFHIGWYTKQGPLSKLYFEDRIDENYVNIVLTDLAEQNMNNTQLAEKIQKLCDEKGCEADLYAFKFLFYGDTQVPNPGSVSGMLNERVEGEKPYYIIMTGPKNYMDKYRKEFKDLLFSAGLEEGEDYFAATSGIDINEDWVDLADVIFADFATFEDIKLESSEKSNEVAEEGEDSSELIAMKSKNLTVYEDTLQLFSGESPVEIKAFQYERAKGVSSKLGDWRLNFFIPLSDGENPRITYECEYHVYELQESENEGEEETPIRKWVENPTSRIELVQEKTTEFEGKSEKYPSAVFFSCTDKKVDKKHDPRESEVLLVIKITKEEIYPYVRPEWIEEFDTGETDDYFTRTYNLNGFYDVLFGYKNKRLQDDTIRFSSIYTQIPIIITNLEK